MAESRVVPPKSSVVLGVLGGSVSSASILSIERDCFTRLEPP
jgi:hypothetical protein